MNFGGIYPALLTPFDKKDCVHKSVLEELVEFNLKKGVKGFYVGGSTAEAFLLSLEERKEILRIVAEKAAGRCVLIAHIGCIAAKHALELGKYAERLGYDMISSIAPFYYKFTFEEIKGYYFEMVDHIGLPMLIYNFPVFSGVNLTVENVSEFLNDERFAGIKHTSTDYFALSRYKAAFPEKLVMNGYDETFLAGLAMGADGAIGSTFNFMADKFIAIQDCFLKSDIKRAQKLQGDANKIIEALCKVGVMQGEKAILEKMGFDFGNARKPFRTLEQKEKDMLYDTIKTYL